MRRALIALILVVIVLTAVSGIILRDYKQLSLERHDIDVRWDQLDKDMKARANLVASLMQPVKAYDRQEQGVLSELAKASAALLASQTKQDEMAANGRLNSALARVFAARDHAGRLASDQTLQDDLADAEQNIANDRADYNEAIQKYNTEILLFPQNVTAAAFHFRRDNAYFQTPEESNKPPQS